LAFEQKGGNVRWPRRIVALINHRNLTLPHGTDGRTGII